jgi:hypothetical protein
VKELVFVRLMTNPKSECALTLTAAGAQGFPKIEDIEIADGFVRTYCRAVPK